MSVYGTSTVRRSQSREEIEGLDATLTEIVPAGGSHPALEERQEDRPGDHLE